MPLIDALDRCQRDLAGTQVAFEFHRETADAAQNGIPDEDVWNNNGGLNFFAKQSSDFVNVGERYKAYNDIYDTLIAIVN